MTQESHPRSLQQLADDLKKATAGSNLHVSTRAGLKLVDKRVAPPHEPIVDGPSEDEYLRRGPNRMQRSLVAFLFGWLTRWRASRRARAEMEREFRLLNYRLKTLLDQSKAMKDAIALGARTIAQQQQRAEVRLQTLQKNHEVLRDTLNAHAEVIDDHSKAITKLQGS